MRDLTKTFRAGGREVGAVERASFDVLEGEFVAIVGASGCGKSTVLNMIGGLVTPSAGAVLVDGAPVRGAAPPRVDTFQGARAVDADLVHSARFLGAGERQILRTVIVPSALAWTFAALTPSISFALIGLVVGELLGGESGGGLGYLITQSLGTLNAADMMVALVSLGVIGILMALGIKQVERRLLRWRPEYRTERA